MNVCSPRNPNICADCEELTFDESPLLLSHQTEAESVPQEPVGHFEQTAFGVTHPALPFHAANNFLPLEQPPFFGTTAVEQRSNSVCMIELPKGHHTIHFGGTFHFEAGELGNDEPFDLPHDITMEITVGK